MIFIIPFQEENNIIVQKFGWCKMIFLSSFAAHCPHATKREVTQKMTILFTG